LKIKRKQEEDIKGRKKQELGSITKERKKRGKKQWGECRLSHPKQKMRAHQVPEGGSGGHREGTQTKNS